jgi:hypothetical protein
MSSALTTLKETRSGNFGVQSFEGEEQQFLLDSLASAIEPQSAANTDPGASSTELIFHTDATSNVAYNDTGYFTIPRSKRRYPRYTVNRSVIQGSLASTTKLAAMSRTSCSIVLGANWPMFPAEMRQYQTAEVYSFHLPWDHLSAAFLGTAWPDADCSQSSSSSLSDKIKQKLESFAHDGTLDRETVGRAFSLLGLLPQAMATPQASPSSDGEIGFFWFHNGDRVEAYLDPEGHLTWIGKFNNAFDPGGDVEWTNTLPPAFLEMLTRLHE